MKDLHYKGRLFRITEIRKELVAKLNQLHLFHNDTTILFSTFPKLSNLKVQLSHFLTLTLPI